MRRMLDLQTSDLEGLSGRDLLAAIRAAEGRTLMAETICTVPPLLGDVSNPETARAFGADLILLNMFDVNAPRIEGLPSAGRPGYWTDRYHTVEGLRSQGTDPVREVKALVGRPVGMNLEPVPDEVRVLGEPVTLASGRTATAENARRARELGMDFLVLTGNPATGVTNDAITEALGEIRRALGDDYPLMAGKMHAAGSAEEAGERMVGAAEVTAWIDAGADVVLLPAPGTVPGVDVPLVQELVRLVHRRGALALTAVGTSQEGADEGTIRAVALASKMAGADLHHLGDSGYSGMALPENLLAYAIAIRGRRHAYRRMATSVGR